MKLTIHAVITWLSGFFTGALVVTALLLGSVLEMKREIDASSETVLVLDQTLRYMETHFEQAVPVYALIEHADSILEVNQKYAHASLPIFSPYIKSNEWYGVGGQDPDTLTQERISYAQSN